MVWESGVVRRVPEDSVRLFHTKIAISLPMSIHGFCNDVRHGLAIVFAATILSVSWAQPIVLSPEKVVELARERSVAVRGSEYVLKGEAYARRGALAPFLPKITVTGNATHLGERPVVGGADFGEALFDTLQYLTQLAGGSLVDSLQNEFIRGLFSGLAQPQALSPQNLYNAGITVAQPIFAGGRLINGYRVARFRHEAQLFSHQRTVTEIGLNGLQLFWMYVLLDAQTATLAESVQWLEKLSTDQRQRYEAGSIIELDVLRTQTQLSESRLQLVKATHQRQTMREQLLNFLDLPMDTLIATDTAGAGATLERFVPPSEDSVEIWLSFREDLLAQERSVEMLAAAKRVQLGAYLPVLNAFYSYTLSNQYSSEETDLDPNESVGISLNWAIWDWGQAFRAYQQAAMQEKAAALRTDALRDRIRLRINELARKVQEGMRALTIAREGWETAKRSLSIAEMHYEAQMITQTDLLQTRAAATQARMHLEAAKVEALLAYEEYKIAPVTLSGGPSGTVP